MAKFIDLNEHLRDSENCRFPEKEALLAQLHEIRTQIKALDLQEPENLESEAYEAWADRHEALEDEEDDILDSLDDLENR